MSRKFSAGYHLCWDLVQQFWFCCHKHKLGVARMKNRRFHECLLQRTLLKILPILVHFKHRNQDITSIRYIFTTVSRKCRSTSLQGGRVLSPISNWLENELVRYLTTSSWHYTQPTPTPYCDWTLALILMLFPFWLCPNILDFLIFSLLKRTVARDFQPLDSFTYRQHLDPGVTPKKIIEFGFEFSEI
jgi:hypothetical protein